MLFFTQVSQILDKIANISLLRAIRNGLALTIPIILVGSFAILINNLPIAAFQNSMDFLFGEEWSVLGEIIFHGTYGIMSICILLCVSYSIALDSKEMRAEQVNIIITCVLSLCCLILLTQSTDDGLGIPYFATSATGLFVAMLTAISSTLIFIKLSSFDCLRIKSFNHEFDSSLNKAITALIPAFLTLSLFALIKGAFLYFGFADIHRLVYDIMMNFFIGMENNLSTAIVYDLFSHLFWFFGMHGTNILEPVSLELYGAALEQNAINLAQDLPPEQIFTKTFFDVFVYMGGCGSTLCLVTAIMLGARKTNLLKIARLSALPALFNINEMLIFGLPVVFNPYYLLPFFLVPIALTLTTYTAMTLGLVPLTVEKAIWTTPILVGGYTTVHSYSGAILQLFNLLVGALIYYPFVQLSEAKRMQRDKHLLQEFYQDVENLESKTVPMLLNLPDTTGSIARNLAQDIKRDLQNGTFAMYYQPQVGNNGKVAGAEALLRWPHPVHGMIPPPVIVTIAEEANLINDLGDRIIEKIFQQVGEWQQVKEMQDLIISFNLSASQMQSKRILDLLQKCLAKYKVDPEKLEIELTEGRLLTNSAQTWYMLEQFRLMGFRFAIDDFGMGHNSMRYLREFSIDTIKLDGSLTLEVLNNKSSQDIVASIVQLANNLHLNIIAEFVENEEQMLMLKKLGCQQYQGYYYAPALPSTDFEEYVINMNT